MRYVLGLVLAGCVLQAIHAQDPESWSGTVTANDVLASELWRIAVATKTKIGFEATDHVGSLRVLKRVPPFPVSTLDDGLTAAVGADDRYEWRMAGDMVLVRPKGAWNDSTNPFNRSMRNVQIESATPSTVVLGLRDFIYSGRFVITPTPTTEEQPVSFSVKSGTVINVLNELVATTNLVLWIGSYRPIGQPADRFPNFDLSLEVRDVASLQFWSGSSPPGHR
jgi:hypothetical protein